MSAPYPFVTNALIEDVSLSIERGFILSGHVSLSFSTSGQSYGGFVLGGVGDAVCADHESQPNIAAIWLTGIFRAADVDDFAKIKGKVIRIAKDEKWGVIRAIGHPIKDDRWFDFETIMNGIRERKEAADNAVAQEMLNVMTDQPES